MPQLAISDQFIEALGRLPKGQQKKVREFTQKFRADPKAAAINYEKIHGAADPRIRTVRVDQKYRAVVLHPDVGDVYVLMWVDNHDEAMQWAENKRFEVHPETGALQILNVHEVTEALRRHDDRQNEQPGLLAHEDSVLLSFGVPEVLLPAVRALKTHDHLLQLQTALPEEAFEALTWLSEGESVDAVRETVGQARVHAPSSNEIAEALENPQTGRRLVRIRSVDDLEQMLAAPLERWRAFLHPQQQSLVEHDYAGPALVMGGAGTGKTVVAMHRARRLARECSRDRRVLVTTFTANLAENVAEVLESMCAAEFERIQVTHLHALAMEVHREAGVVVQIAETDQIAVAWDQISLDSPGGLSADQLRDEWNFAFRLGGVRERDQYLRISRVGRTPSLSRRQRVAVWEAFEEFQRELGRQGGMQWSDVVQGAEAHVRAAPKPPFHHAIVDEAQDFDAMEWRFIRSLVEPHTNDLFLVADPRQRIYHRPVSLAACDIDVADRVFPLRINYRTTEQIRHWATERTPAPEHGDLVDSAAISTPARSLFEGPEPEFLESPDDKLESRSLATLCSELMADFAPHEVAIVVRASRLLKQIKKQLHERSIPYQVLDRSVNGSIDGVRLATMHRVKGLEFRCVVIAGLSKETFPTRYRGPDGDVEAKRLHLLSERNLLYVAATRARERLILSSHGSGFSWP